MLKWTCPECGNHHRIKCDDFVGLEFVCSECSKEFESFKLYWEYKP